MVKFENEIVYHWNCPRRTVLKFMQNQFSRDDCTETYTKSPKFGFLKISCHGTPLSFCICILFQKCTLHGPIPC